MHKKALSRLQRYGRDHGISGDQVNRSIDILTQLLHVLGEQSASLDMSVRIGRVLIDHQHSGEKVQIVAPSCPDYTHNDGKYTFMGLNAGVPLLAQLQTSLLKKMEDILGNVTIHLVVADQEANDKALRTKMQVSEEDFLHQIEGSVASIKAATPDHWQIGKMTDLFPSLLGTEASESIRIQNDPGYRGRLLSDTSARSEMYRKVGVHSPVDMMDRTIRTAAQYAAIGKLVADRGWMICNHQTVNLAWLKEAKAPVLHNGVSIY